MKKTQLFLSAIAFIIAAVTFTACSTTKDEFDAPTLKLDPSSPTSVSFTSENYDTPVEITIKSNVVWTPEPADSWVKAKRSGNKLLISAHAPGYENRTSKVIIKGIGVDTEIEIPVTQPKKVIELSFSQESVTLDRYILDNTVIEVTSNDVFWNVATDINWATVTKVGKSIIIKGTHNTTTSARSGEITVTIGSETYKLPINQLAGSAPGGHNIEDFVLTYTATGTPSFLSTPGPSTWDAFSTLSGESDFSDGAVFVWGLGGDMTTGLSFDFVNGRLVCSPILLSENSTQYWVQAAMTSFDVDSEVVTLHPYVEDTEWNSVTQTLTLPKKDANGKVLKWGVILINKRDNSLAGVATDLYADLSYTYRAVAPPVAGQVTTNTKTSNIRPFRILDLKLAQILATPITVNKKEVKAMSKGFKF